MLFLHIPGLDMGVSSNSIGIKKQDFQLIIVLCLFNICLFNESRRTNLPLWKERRCYSAIYALVIGRIDSGTV